MSDQSAFLAAILAEPANDGPRLVYADYLDERGSAYGEFIRVQCELARWQDVIDATPVGRQSEDGSEIRSAAQRGVALRYRERELWARLGHDWLNDTFPGYFAYFDASRAEEGLLLRSPDGDTSRIATAFRRGFVEGVTCTAADWLTHADALLSAAPIRAVTLTTWPEVEFVEDTSRGLVSLRLAGRSGLVGPYTAADLGHGEDVMGSLFAAEWAGVTFTLPALGTTDRMATRSRTVEVTPVAWWGQEPIVYDLP